MTTNRNNRSLTKLGVELKTKNSPRLTSRTGTLRRRQSGYAGMDESRALALFVYSLEVDDKAARIMLGEREDLGAKEGHNVVGDDVARLRLEVGVVDAQAVVEPVHLVGDKFAGDEALDHNEISIGGDDEEDWNEDGPWQRRPARPEPAAHPCP